MAKRNGIIKALIQIGLILVVLALIFFSLNSVLPGFIDVLANGQQSDVQEYLNSFHDFSGYAIGFLLQFIQIITIALPSVPIQVAVGVIFGTWRGFLVCYLGYVSANALIFISVRKLGAKLEQLLYVCSAAAAAVKHIGIVIQFQVFKPPVRQRAVANVHH